jgi:ribosomal protein L31E
VREVVAKEIKLLRVQTETNKKKHERGWEMPAWEFRVDIHRRMEEKGEQGEVAATKRTCLTSVR